MVRIYFAYNLVSSTVISKQKKGSMNTFLEDEVNSEANRRTQPLSVDILMGERPTPRFEDSFKARPL